MAEPVSVARNVAEALLQWAREESGRMSERASENAGAVLRELGFVTHREHEELELRVAQLEHRLRLLESETAPVTLQGRGAATTEDTEPRASL